MAVFTFEQRQEIRAHVEERMREKFRRYVEISQRYLSHLIQRRYLFDEPPAVRWAQYIMAPPQLPDGTISPPGPNGEWDYPALAAEMPWLYDKILRDWLGLLNEGLRNEAS